MVSSTKLLEGEKLGGQTHYCFKEDFVFFNMGTGPRKGNQASMFPWSKNPHHDLIKPTSKCSPGNEYCTF